MSSSCVLPISKYWERKDFVQDAVNADFQHFPVALRRTGEYNTCNEHSYYNRNGAMACHIGLWRIPMNTKTVQNNMIIGIILIGALIIAL